MRPLRQWESGPFEQLVHAETHYKNGGDFDRRMAVISYDNAIEVSIHTYLNLHPIQRLNREYANADVQRWLSNYHAMISFFVREVTSRQLSHLCDEAEFIGTTGYGMANIIQAERRYLKGKYLMAYERRPFGCLALYTILQT